MTADQTNQLLTAKLLVNLARDAVVEAGGAIAVHVCRAAGVVLLAQPLGAAKAWGGVGGVGDG